MNTNYKPSVGDPVECILLLDREPGDPRPLRTQGEIIEKTDKTIKVEGRQRIIEVDLNDNTVEFVKSRMFRHTKGDYPLDTLRELTIDELLLGTDLPDYTERFTEGKGSIEDIDGALESANTALRQIVEEFGEKWIGNHSWIGHCDAFYAYYVYENGIQKRIDNFNTYYGSDKSDYEITFATKESALIWIEEICGQISDGAWEGSVDNWEDYCDATIKLNTELDHPILDGDLRQLNYKDELLEFDGLAGRMIFYVLASKVNTEFGRDDLSETLEQIEAMHN